MSASRGEQIMEAIAAALNAPSNKPAPTYRENIDALASADLPAFCLYALPETVGVAGAKTRLRKRKVRVEVHVGGVPPIDAVADPLYVFAVNTILGDATLQGLVKGVYESGLQWETAQSYEDRCLVAIDFEVHYTTGEDPTAAGAQ
jgi:hypothetical protein